MSLDIAQYRIGQGLLQGGIFLLILLIDLLLGDSLTELVLTFLYESPSRRLRGIDQLRCLVIIAIELRAAQGVILASALDDSMLARQSRNGKAIVSFQFTVL